MTVAENGSKASQRRITCVAACCSMCVCMCRMIRKDTENGSKASQRRITCVGGVMSQI